MKLKATLAEHPGHLLLIGDFNFHVDDLGNGYARRFADVLEAFDLQQHVRGVTHKDGHTLDLLITRTEDTLIKKHWIQDPAISDHRAIHFDLFLPKPKFAKKTVEYRKLRDIDMTCFSDDILDSALFDEQLSSANLNTRVDHYNCVLKSLLDKHAPLKRKTVTIRPSSPWYTLEVAEEKRKRRRLERKLLKTRSQTDRDHYVYQCRVVIDLIDGLRSSYYTSIIHENSKDQKILFKTVNKLLQKNRPQRYPSAPSNGALANCFADFFTEKIAKIHRSLSEKYPSADPTPYPDNVCSAELCEFNEVTQEDVKAFATKSMSKSCQLDPIPASILKGCFEVLLPVITKIVNLSLLTGFMPDTLKLAESLPTLKKPDADYEQYLNFRPISNLPLVSKVIEKAIADQFIHHISTNCLDEPLQSAYKLYHSTETALIKVQNDILCAIDNRQSVILLMLDLSAAALDTVEHSIIYCQGFRRALVSRELLYLVYFIPRVT